MITQPLIIVNHRPLITHLQTVDPDIYSRLSEHEWEDLVSLITEFSVMDESYIQNTYDHGYDDGYNNGRNDVLYDMEDLEGTVEDLKDQIDMLKDELKGAE